MYTSTLSSQGQIFIPKPLRTTANLSPGTPIHLKYDPIKHAIVLEPAESITALATRISTHIRPGTTPIRDVRTWLNKNQPTSP
jgi:AbrB family looped-hinge helix DNA binding protein